MCPPFLPLYVAPSERPFWFLCDPFPTPMMPWHCAAILHLVWMLRYSEMHAYVSYWWKLETFVTLSYIHIVMCLTSRGLVTSTTSTPRWSGCYGHVELCIWKLFRWILWHLHFTIFQFIHSKERPSYADFFDKSFYLILNVSTIFSIVLRWLLLAACNRGAARKSGVTKIAPCRLRIRAKIKARGVTPQHNFGVLMVC